jgi:hypothetical protein
MSRIQSPCALRRSWLPYDARHDSRSPRGQRYNLLCLILFPRYSRTRLIYALLKGLFPAEINQPTDDKYFD